MMPTLAYNAPETEQFRQDYQLLVNSDVPLLFLEEAIAKYMYGSGRKHFRVPAILTKYNKDLFFVFDVDPEYAPKSIIYRYNRVTTRDIVLRRYEPADGVSSFKQPPMSQIQDAIKDL